VKWFKPYLPETLGLAVGLGLLNLWYLTGLAIENDVIPVHYDYVIKGFTIAIGAFLGAYSAYWLKHKQDKEEELNQNALCIQKTMFTLWRMRNAIVNYKERIDKHETIFGLAFNCPAFAIVQHKELQIDFESLSFLMSVKQTSAITRLCVVQEFYNAAMRSFEDRSNFHLNTFLPRVELVKHELKKLRETTILTETAMKDVIGQDVFARAIFYASQMKKFGLESNDAIEFSQKIMYELSGELFPERDFQIPEFEEIKNYEHN
jgi:hypothetical protein